MNDATPREKERSRERSREPRVEEAWQQPPTLQHNDSKKRSQNKGGRSQTEQGAQHPEVPGAVEQPENDQTTGEGTLACFFMGTGSSCNTGENNHNLCHLLNASLHVICLFSKPSSHEPAHLRPQLVTLPHRVRREHGIADSFRPLQSMQYSSVRTSAKMEKQRLELLEKKLAEQEKQTKMLYERLGRGNTFSSLPPAGANGHGPTSHAAGAGHRRAPALASRRASEGTNRKDRFEQLLMESAARAKEKTEQKKMQAHDVQAGDEPALHRQSSKSISKKAPRSARSHDNISFEGDSVEEGYSKAAALDSIEQMPADKEGGEKKRGKSKRDLISVQEQTAEAVGRTESGAEIDLETGLPKEDKKSGFSWFYAVCFVILVAILIYASIIILQRYS